MPWADRAASIAGTADTIIATNVGFVADAPIMLAPGNGAASVVRFRVSNGGNRAETLSRFGGIARDGASAGLVAGESGSGADAGIPAFVGATRSRGSSPRAAQAPTGAGAPGSAPRGPGGGGADALGGPCIAAAVAFAAKAAPFHGYASA